MTKEEAINLSCSILLGYEPDEELEDRVNQAKRETLQGNNKALVDMVYERERNIKEAKKKLKGITNEHPIMWGLNFQHKCVRLIKQAMKGEL